MIEYSLKLKKKISDEVLEQATDDFWYDLFEGGYIIPENYLTEEDAKKVNKAKEVLHDFKGLLETEELIGEM